MRACDKCNGKGFLYRLEMTAIDLAHLPELARDIPNQQIPTTIIKCPQCLGTGKCDERPND